MATIPNVASLDLITAAWANAIAAQININTLAGSELLYAQITANVPITATTAAGAQTVINPGNITYDGSAVWLEVDIPGLILPNVANAQIIISLWDTNTDIGNLVALYAPIAIGLQAPAFQRYRFTPTAGVHNYNLRAWINPSGTGTIVAGGAYKPAFLRITKA